MKKIVSLLAVFTAVAALCSGCSGHSAQQSSSTEGGGVAGKNWMSAANRPSGVDASTEKMLMAEWRAARFSCTGEKGGCPRQVGAFATGQVLLSAMRRINHSIPATDNLNATMSLERFVFVLDDSTSNRLDLATADAKGRYVHLIAVGATQPHLRFGPLSPLSANA